MDFEELKKFSWRHRLRIKRRVLGLSQAEHARRVGKSSGWLSLVERGYLWPDQGLRERLEKCMPSSLSLERLVDKVKFEDLSSGESGRRKGCGLHGHGADAK